jgi:hypothetical protein
LDTFNIKHIPRQENSRANVLAQQASGYVVTKGMFLVKTRPVSLSSLMCGIEPVLEMIEASKGQGAQGSVGSEVTMDQAVSNERKNEVRPMPGKEKSVQTGSDGLVTMKSWHGVDEAEERPVVCDGVTGLAQNFETVANNGGSLTDWRAPLINCIKNPGSTKQNSATGIELYTSGQ